jgi:secreted PhoX family phosphatase
VSKLGRRAVVAAAGALPLAWLLARRSSGSVGGVLVPDPDGLLDLREGFTYTVLQQRRARMSDGYRVPDEPDGMACFEGPAGSLILMRNHELNPGQWAGAPYARGAAPPEAFSPDAPGCVTRLVVDAASLEVVSSNLVLAGTLRNCSGGLSPWGWLSCEEIADKAGHGYVFACPIDAANVAPARPLRGYGRFRHEAAHVDPRTKIAYLTEDEPLSSLFRFLPSGGDPHTGTLQAMAIAGAPSAALSQMELGQRLEVSWVDIDDAEAQERSVNQQAQGRGSAIVIRGEGLWLHGDVVYFCSTAGGPFEAGQIFKLVPEGDGGVLELVAMGTDPDVLKRPDNITVHPSGGVVVAEDGPGADYLRGLTPDGRPFDIARNARSEGELSGVCFDPSGSTLFANLQHEGLTLAIRGPMHELFGAWERA